MIQKYTSPLQTLYNYADNELRGVDFAAVVDDRITLEQAVRESGMTDRQEQVLRLRAIEGYSVADLQYLLNLDKGAISHYFKSAALKLLKVYQRWEGMND